MRPVTSIVSVFLTVSNTLAQDSCSSSQVCIPLRSCQDAAELILEAQTTDDDSRKNHIIELLRGRVCGRKADRSVCCESDVQTGQTLPLLNSDKLCRIEWNLWF